MLVHVRKLDGTKELGFLAPDKRQVWCIQGFRCFPGRQTKAGGRSVSLSKPLRLLLAQVPLDSAHKAGVQQDIKITPANTVNSFRA
jgi:hypothetical protein